MMQQNMEALKRANDVRLARAEIKKEIGRGDASVADVLETMPDVMETITLLELLCAQRRVGVHRARRLAVALGVPETKQIGTLTLRQRRVACQLLGVHND